jgi:cobyrinic acid a,c-diamide synthase
MQKRLAALGPQQLAMDDGVLRGHAFHYSTCATSLAGRWRTARPNLAPTPDAGEAVFESGSVRASYFHAWFASSPAVTAALFLPVAAPAKALAGEPG